MQQSLNILMRSALLAVLLVTAAAAGRAAERPSLYGFAPAYPADTLPPFSSERHPPHTAYERLVRVELTIDKDGAVKKGKPSVAADSLYYQYVAGYCKAMRFVPAAIDGGATGSVLPVDVVLTPRSDRPEFVFPIDRNLQIANSSHYLAVYPLNDIQPPKVVVFPKYFADLHWSDTARQYPFVLIKLSLDAAGGVVGVEPVRSTLPSFTQTTMSAAIWGTYEPLAVKGKKRAADCFLLVSYFPQVSYPTQRWLAAAADTLPPMERSTVRVLPDTAGIIVPPVVRRLQGNLIDVRDTPVYFNVDTVGAFFAVDSLGTLRVHRFDTRLGELSKAMRWLGGKVSFYPAMDLEGRPRSYRWWARGTGSPSGALRIDYVW